MGVLNITPDSFYSDSRITARDEVLNRAGKMLEHGATILDVGGYSSRPGADDITVQEELHRVIPALESLIQEFPDTIISIDTFRSKVASAAVEAGACIINDISGGGLDGQMFETVAKLRVPYVLMHMKGSPATMAGLANYDNLFFEIMDYFQLKINQLRALGVNDIVVDPGIGFAKKANHSFELLKNLQYLLQLGYPLLVGLSRKSMIYKTLGVEPGEALNGTTALNMVALCQGASILRVHDVKEAAEVIKLYNRIFN